MFYLCGVVFCYFILSLYFVILFHLSFHYFATSFGMRQTATGLDYAVASESVAIDALDSQFKLARDVAAGEAIFINLKVIYFILFYVFLSLHHLSVLTMSCFHQS